VPFGVMLLCGELEDDCTLANDAENQDGHVTPNPHGDRQFVAQVGLEGVMRIGTARLLKFAFDGNDLSPLRSELKAMSGDPGALMDLSVIEQIIGNHETGLALQQSALGRHSLYLSPGCAGAPRLRVLALAAPLEVGANLPVEFLVNAPDIQLTTLYVTAGLDFATTVPEHDVAIVVITDGDDSALSLDLIAQQAAIWPSPLLNLPDKIRRTDRDRLFGLLQGAGGIDIPITIRVSRADLLAIADGSAGLPGDLAFPVIVRPLGSHAGEGLDRLTGVWDITAYLQARGEDGFFFSPFVDYSGADGLFRKYRIVFIDGVPFAYHMAISHQWKIWYLNAGMDTDPEKRAEEALFMSGFEEGFGNRHRTALAAVASAVGLDFFSIDCGETKDGRLLIFEAGVAMAIHDMDPVDLDPYKPPVLAKIFAAFQAMVSSRADAFQAALAAAD
jgi:hypothetical protein